MTGQDWEHLGTVIRLHRRRNRMSQSDLARATGLSLRTIGNYERGRAPGSAPIVPDGYYDVARAFNWATGSVDKVLAGGEPEIVLTGERHATEEELAALATPALNLTDVARDMGAPAEVVDRYRLAAVALIGWMSANAAAAPQSSTVPRAVGQGVSAEDAERILRHVEGDK
ncbi:helix-turn-helix transcriptional regulator [Streptomyces sp. NPDC059783]|uniref:helix-turn-helix transcriptional regulator n=1 Tax=Streptomyces sp. NPDC059783 TaxID=3346944 RepID=UPI0036492CB1